MKRILCYGDSNTWGYDPATGSRFDKTARWPRVMGKALGRENKILEAGLNGRTTIWDDPLDSSRNGAKALPPCLTRYRPLDMVIILLGTNDLKKRFNLSAQEIARGAGELATMVLESGSGRDGQAPRVLLLAPPPLATLTAFGEEFEGGEGKSRMLSAEYEKVAKELGCAFLDASLHIVSSPLDGIHLEAPQQRALGEAVAVKVKYIEDQRRFIPC